MDRKIIILVPRLDFSGPVRGAIALLNGFLHLGRDAQIIPVYEGKKKIFTKYNNFLTKEKNFIKKVYLLKNFCNSEVNKSERKLVIITFCFIADFISWISGFGNQTISSVRGDLYKNYKDDYGIKGVFLAWLHYKILSKLKVLTALNEPMTLYLKNYSSNVFKIPNFLDEKNIQCEYKKLSGAFRFVFVGKLSKRKAVLETLDAFYKVLNFFPDCQLHILGEGAIKKTVLKKIKDLNLNSKVKFHGFIEDPLKIVSNCDVFVLPSYSEGISRAAMEALFLGKRCIMQNVDGNNELISSNLQGVLINQMLDLSDEMIKMLKRGRIDDKMRLPKNFRQYNCVKQYIDLTAKF